MITLTEAASDNSSPVKARDEIYREKKQSIMTDPNSSSSLQNGSCYCKNKSQSSFI